MTIADEVAKLRESIDALFARATVLPFVVVRSPEVRHSETGPYDALLQDPETGVWFIYVRPMTMLPLVLRDEESDR